jgi:integrase/recombinase XerD
MANREVNLTKRARIAGSPRYCPVVFSANGRVKPDYVIVCQDEERHPEGSYYIEWYEGSKRRRLSVGKNAADAQARLLAKTAELNAIAAGVQVVRRDDKTSMTLTVAIQDFLDKKSVHRKKKTHVDYATALRYFQESCQKPYLEDVTRADLLGFAAYCRDQLELSPRTVFNKFARIVAFLRAHGIKVHSCEDVPVFTEELPEIYEPEELDTLFAACNEQERLWFEFFLMTGMREQEVMHVCWKDIKAEGIVRVTHKPEFSWTPKAYKEREIPIPSRLAEALKKQRAKANGCPLIFPTAGCRPKLDFLDCLKKVAKRAGLEQENFWLHKFRATFATRCLWAGVDLRTVQQWLGHSDMESTMRYLKPSRSQEVREKVNAIFA